MDLEKIQTSKEGKLIALEPALENVPPAMIRRMSKAVRMGLGSGLPIITKNIVDGIIIGTANGGMEDCIKFLNQIIDYNEGVLTPGNFVQSSRNTIAAQLCQITKNRVYNATHVHLGLAFENALTDAQMLLKENPQSQYLVGAVEEISSYNYNIDRLAGWYNEAVENNYLYDAHLPTTIAGEGAAMFLVNNRREDALAKITAIEMVHTTDLKTVKNRFENFLRQQKIHPEKTIFISGENGDTRLNPFYEVCEENIKTLPVLHYKHFTGEYPTVSSFAVWLACYALQHQTLPEHFYKNTIRTSQMETAILYNHYQGKQHSFMSVSCHRLGV
jgi:hypothetical protein